MMVRVRKLILILTVAFLMTALNAASVQSGAVLADLENALMCKCDDKCGKVLINCTCSTADKTRREYSKMLESGLTVEQIIQQQIEKYGETVLSAPTKSGFNLTAWVMPFGALLVGGLGLRRLLQVWTGKGGPEPETTEGGVEGTSDPGSDKYSLRLQDELDRLEM